MRRLLVAGAVALVGACVTLWAPGRAHAVPNTLGVDHDGAPPDINAGPAMVATGASTTISIVTETPAAGLGAWTVNVRYDPAVLTPTGCIPTGASAACNLAFAPDQVRFAATSAGGAFGVLGVAAITFQAIGAPGQCSALTPSVVTWNDPSGNNAVRPVVSAGQVCVSAAPTPTPTPPPTPSPTPTPAPTPTPSPTPTPTPTPSTKPTPTPTTKPTPTSATHTCDGQKATIVGTNWHEVLVGTRGDDVIVALGGSDLVIGLGGDDRICLGSGHDVALSGEGADRAFGERGYDVLSGGDGADFLDGGAEYYDVCLGGPGLDKAVDCEFQISVP